MADRCGRVARAMISAMTKRLESTVALVTGSSSGIGAATARRLAAAEAAGDQVALGWTHEIIGRYGTFSGADDEDLAHLARALDHFQRAGDLAGQAWAYLTAGLAYGMKGDWAEAIPRAGQALALFRQTGDQAGQGWALSGLGQCHARLGNSDLGRRYARQALEVTPRPVMPAARSVQRSCGTITTGQAECWTTSLLTEPASSRVKPLPPRAPTTTRSASCEASTSSLTTKPFKARTVTEAGPAPSSRLAALCVISSAAWRRLSSSAASAGPTTGMWPQ